MDSRAATRMTGSSRTLGLFVMPHSVPESGWRFTNYPYPRFLYTSEEGKDLKEGKWGNLDESLSFLDNHHEDGIYILCSANGFLLCCANRRGSNDYVICNPVTREFRNLPRPQRAYFYSNIALNCKARNTNEDATSLMFMDEVHFEVVRAGVSNTRKFTTTLELDTYSSITNTWTESCVGSDCRFILRTTYAPGFVIGKVVYWRENFGSLLAYDRAKQHVVLIKPPPNKGQQSSKFVACFQKKEKFVCYGSHYGRSEGKVQYSRHNNQILEIWVLKNYKRNGSTQWEIRHRVSFDEIKFYNPEIYGNQDACCSIESFDPLNSGLVLVTILEKAYWFDIANIKLIEVPGFIEADFFYNFFTL